MIVERAAGAEVLVTNKVPLRAATLSRLPDLCMVAVLATGYDIIDTADAAAHGIPVCNVVAYGVDDVAQHAWALLLELCRRTSDHTASVRAGEWKDTWCYWKTTPICLRGRTLGVIGFGSIGRRVGELGHAFGMSVLANCRTPRNPPSYSPFAFASTDQIFQQADVISLHCPLTDATRAIINAKALARMKPGAILINTARGLPRKHSGTRRDSMALTPMEHNKLIINNLPYSTCRQMAARGVGEHAYIQLVTLHENQMAEMRASTASGRVAQLVQKRTAV